MFCGGSGLCEPIGDDRTDRIDRGEEVERRVYISGEAAAAAAAAAAVSAYGRRVCASWHRGTDNLQGFLLYWHLRQSGYEESCTLCIYGLFRFRSQ